MDGLPDITTMKVAELKKELKARGLTTTGNKVELIDRLQLAMVPPEDNSDLLDDTNDLLGEDDDEPMPSDVNESNAELVEQPPHTSPTSTAAADVAEEKPKDELVVGEVSLEDSEVKVAASVTSTSTAKKRITAPEDDSTAATIASTEAATKSGEIETDDAKPKQKTDAERAAARAARFGITPSSDPDTKKASRAERFGLPASGGSSKIGESPKVDMETLKKRAERFGQCSSTTMKKMEMTEQINKRKERFGEPEDSAKKPKVDVNESLLVDEKMKKRAERFGTAVQA